MTPVAFQPLEELTVALQGWVQTIAGMKEVVDKTVVHLQASRSEETFASTFVSTTETVVDLELDAISLPRTMTGCCSTQYVAQSAGPPAKSENVVTRLFAAFDYAAARIAYNIIWDRPSMYTSVLVHMCAFHTMCSYMGSFGKMTSGSGFKDILMEADVSASGSINQVMNGCNYNQAMRVHQHMADAVERLMLGSFLLDMSLHFDHLPELVSLAVSYICWTDCHHEQS